ncbi:MAG: HAD-IIIA family hydrolase [Planctomycetota bacterium]
MTRTVLLDRDGVLNVDRPNYVLSLDQLELEANAAAGVAALTSHGCRLLVITNQACVAKGLISREDLERLHAELVRRLAAQGGRIERIYLCPHGSEVGCACRKPKPGLINQARADFGFAPADTWMVGDAERDLQAAQAAGCLAALVKTGKGGKQAVPPGVPVFADLLAFAQWYATSEARA